MNGRAGNPAGDAAGGRAPSRAAARIAALWGFAEATVFFIVPDVWIGLLAAFDPRAGLRAAAA
ncbi:MAG: hypothetical protein ACKOWF_05500, partial [Chloroflexota bacterium]